MIRMNINDPVWIKITPRGEQILHEHYQSLNMPTPEFKKNWDGFTKFQLWEVMNYFGAHMHNGADVPFETEINLSYD